MTLRTARLLFVAFVAATLVHIALVMVHEPFAYDAWNIAVDTHAEPFSFSRFANYWANQYTHSNPRVGQAFTYLAYKLVWFAPIVTPLAYLAVAVAVVALGTGRMPAWSRGRDLALVAIALGFAWFALPHLGMLMFCRAYGANYLYGAAIQLWFLVPIRLRAHNPTVAGMPACVAYAVLGVIAGACNEHTGPTLCAFMMIYAGRRYWTGAPSRLARTGALAAAVGFALIFFAPGQDHRYDDLAQRAGLLDRLIARGVTVNFDIYRDYLLAVAPVLALIAAALALGALDPLTDEARAARRTALHVVALVLAAGTLITITVFVSPKLGPRFYMHAAALALAGFIAVADAVLTTPRRLAPFIVLAVAAFGFAVAHTLPLYLRLDGESDARLAILAQTPRGAELTVDAWDQVDPSWWFLGDDLRDQKKRDLIADYFDLQRVVFRGLDLDAPLGISDVHLVPHAALAPASCLDEHGGLELGPFRGLDVGSIHHALRDAITVLQAKLPAGAVLRHLDLEVEFSGARPELPRPHLLVARWRPDGFDGWVAQIQRRRASNTRDVLLPAELRGTPFEIYIYSPGSVARRLGTAQDTELSYVPWRSGAYWVLACRPEECFVIDAVRQGG